MPDYFGLVARMSGITDLLNTSVALERIAKGSDETLTATHVAVLRDFLLDHEHHISRHDLVKYLKAALASHERLRTERVLVTLVPTENRK